MTETFKVVVAGAGPGGCIFARDLARAGINVVVYEKGGLETLGHNWSDAVERIALQEVGFEVPTTGPVNQGPLVKVPGQEISEQSIFEQHAYPKMDVWAPDYSCKKTIKFRYITTDRRALGRLLAKQAMDAGAEFKFGHEVIAPLVSGGNSLDGIVVHGIKVKNLADGSIFDVEADLTADDTGYGAILRSQLPPESGIAQAFTDDEFAMVHRTVRKRDLKKVPADPIIDHYRYAFQTGYQWVQLLNELEIDIGAGVKYKADVQAPAETVTQFIAQHPSITDEVVRGGGGRCLVGRSPYSLVTGGLVILGDAASQTIPMTGCGAGGAMMGGKLAAETAITAARTGNADLATLWSYNHKWFVQSGRGANYAALTALRNILQKLPQEQNAFLFLKDVFSGEMLTSSINGIFQIPTLPLMLKTLFRCLSRPGLLLTLNKATTVGTKLYKHYLKFPKDWNRQTFEKWRQKADQLFLKVN